MKMNFFLLWIGKQLSLKYNFGLFDIWILYILPICNTSILLKEHFVRENLKPSFIKKFLMEESNSPTIILENFIFIMKHLMEPTISLNYAPNTKKNNTHLQYLDKFSYNYYYKLNINKFNRLEIHRKELLFLIIKARRKEDLLFSMALHNADYKRKTILR